MTPDDRKVFAEIVIGFAELKGKQLSAPAIELYWRAMRHWPLADFRAASEHLLRTSEFMPTPNHFEALRKAARVTVGEAWAAVLEHAKGAYRNGSGLDNGGPIDQAIAAIGGYRAIAFHEVEKLHFLERQFADRFEEIRDVADVRLDLPQLAVGAARPRLDGPRKLSDLLPAVGSST